MKKIAVPFAIIASIAVICVIFYFSRPSVAFVVDSLDDVFTSRIPGPSAICTDYRSRRIEAEPGASVSGYDLVIDMTRDGIDSDTRKIRPEYDRTALFSAALSQIADAKVYVLYDSEDPGQMESFEAMRKLRPDIEALPYGSSFSRSMYPLFESKIEDGSYLVVFDASATIDFIRSLSVNVSLVTDYLDYAALTERNVSVVASPDWDAVISDALSK